jgi:hypothetical protein
MNIWTHINNFHFIFKKKSTYVNIYMYWIPISFLHCLFGFFFILITNLTFTKHILPLKILENKKFFLGVHISITLNFSHFQWMKHYISIINHSFILNLNLISWYTKIVCERYNACRCFLNDVMYIEICVYKTLLIQHTPRLI